MPPLRFDRVISPDVQLRLGLLLFFGLGAVDDWWRRRRSRLFMPMPYRAGVRNGDRRLCRRRPNFRLYLLYVVFLQRQQIVQIKPAARWFRLKHASRLTSEQ